MTENDKPVSAAGKAVSLLLALLPPARMAWIVFTNGENNLSNDYLMRVPLVGSMLDGTCSIGRFAREAWIGGAHSGLAVFPIYYLNARLFHWSVWIELGLGLGLVAATLALLVRAIPGHRRWLLLPLLSLLLFSTSRVTVFTFGEPALQYGISQLGVAIGVWAIARWRERPIALATALAFGGLLASWSWGGGVMAWPVFTIALMALHVRSSRAWAIFLSAAAVGVAQYVWLLFFVPGASANEVGSGPNVLAIVDLLGRPFIGGIASDYGPSLASRGLGLAGLAMLAVLLVRGRRAPERAPALVPIGWSLLVAAQIAMLRSQAAPWYASPMALFWAGLAILLALEPVSIRAGGIAAIALPALMVQRTWEDKSFYLPSRSPASAACLREWRTAPTGCATLLFQWRGGAGPAGLGEPLERHHLSVFGPRRTYLLQGDVGLGRVALERPNLPAFLSRDGLVPADPKDFHRLDAVLAPGAVVTWRVDVPTATRTARFHSVVRTAPGGPSEVREAAVSASAGPDGPALTSRVFLPQGEKRELALELSRFAGKTVRLSLISEEARAPGAPLLWKAPRIDLALERTK